MRTAAAIVTSAVLVLSAAAFDARADEDINRAKTTLERMKSISTAIEAYMTDYDKAPEAATVKDLEPQLSPAYIRQLPLTDGWDTPFRYVRTGEESFEIVSAGSDRKFDEKSWADARKSKDLAADVVLVTTSGSETFLSMWLDASGQPLAMTYAEAAAEIRPVIDAEAAKMKSMPEEQSWAYFRTKTTSERMIALTAPLDRYKAAHGSYPGAKSNVELARALFPAYAAELPTTDAWGTELQYTVSKDGKGYTLASAGSDRKFDPSSWSKRATLTTAADDAVIVDGAFVRAWAEDVKDPAAKQ